MVLAFVVPRSRFFSPPNNCKKAAFSSTQGTKCSTKGTVAKQSSINRVGGQRLENNKKALNYFFNSHRRAMVGLPGFEPESIEPKSTSLDQASRQPQTVARNIISDAS
jgi:hypothetical protein